MSRSRAGRPPSPEDAFEEADRALALRVVAGEITVLRAEVLAAGGRWLAFSRKYRETCREVDALQKEALRVLQALRQAKDNEGRWGELMVDWAKLYADRRHHLGPDDEPPPTW